MKNQLLPLLAVLAATGIATDLAVRHPVAFAASAAACLAVLGLLARR